jgi:hypothetical protein
VEASVVEVEVAVGDVRGDSSELPAGPDNDMNEEMGKQRNIKCL